MRWLASHLFDRADFEGGERGEKVRDQGQKIREAVRFGAQDHDAQGPVCDVLLLWEALVDGDERVEEPVHGVEKLTVVEVAPTHFGRGPNLVARQALAKTLRNAGIQEYSHPGPLGSRRHRFG
jgi:hypothetical protein